MCKISTDALNMCSVNFLCSCREEPKPPNGDDLPALCCAAGRLLHPIPCACGHPPASVLFGSRGTSLSLHPAPGVSALDAALAVGTADTPCPSANPLQPLHGLSGSRTPDTGEFELCPLKLPVLLPGRSRRRGRYREPSR